MTTIIGVSGSLRRQSFNSALLRAAAEFMPPGTTFRTLRMHPWFEGRLMVARAGEVFDAQGRIVDEQIHARLREFVQGFAAFVAGR